MGTVATKFYTFDQNNTGGSFDHMPASGIGYKVAFEATDVQHAKQRALSAGVYFNGCDDGRDCPCCGDRWSSWIDESDATDEPETHGKPLTGGWGIPSYMLGENGIAPGVRSVLDAALFHGKPWKSVAEMRFPEMRRAMIADRDVTEGDNL